MAKAVKSEVKEDRAADGSRAGVRIATVEITGASPIYFSRPFPADAKRGSDESHDDYDARLCRERAHYDEAGRVVIPGVMVHKALVKAAKFRGDKIPGAGAKTWTKRFGAGILVLDNFPIEPETTRDTLKIRAIFVPADGKVGSTSPRVYRRFPVIEEWSATLIVHVLDGLIDEQVFAEHMATAGMYEGIGSFRPGSPSPNVYGRFSVGAIKWGKLA